MKALICGKGGAGKSAVTILAARMMAGERSVYVLDSDESNRLLARSMGVEPPDTIGNYLGGRKALRDNLAGHDRIRIGELPDEFRRVTAEGITFASVGKIEEYGEGCACPYGFLSKELLKRVELGPGDVLLVDAEAGVEHLGRGVEEGIDAVVVVVDPTAEGVAIASLLKGEADRIGKPLFVVLNKVTEEVEPLMRARLMEEGLEAAAVVMYDEEVFRSSLAGGPLKAGEALLGVRALVGRLL